MSIFFYLSSSVLELLSGLEVTRENVYLVSFYLFFTSAIFVTQILTTKFTYTYKNKLLNIKICNIMYIFIACVLYITNNQL